MPSLLTATPTGKSNVAFEAGPSSLPLFPDPARVVTFPSGVILRIRRFPTSATKRLPKDTKIKLKNGKRANYSTMSGFESASKKQKKGKGKNPSKSVTLSPEQKRVLDIIINEGKSVFFTGSAGT